MIQKYPLAALAPPVVVSYSILNKKKYVFFLWQPWLLQWSLLIQFLFRIDANGPLAAFAPPVVVSYFKYSF